MIIAVVTESYRVFKIWCNENRISETSKLIRCVSRSEHARGIKFDAVIKLDMWPNRDINEALQVIEERMNR